MILQNFKKQQLLVDCPDWLPDNTPYLVMMGSAAYGVSSDDSDVDYYGFTFPPKDDVFPHLKGEIVGFGEPSKPFGTWQQHHLKTPGKEYDFTIHSIVKYFQLCMENNPNMIDSLFVPERCIHHITGVGQLVRDNRHIFLHKGCWHRFKHYAYAQMHKLEIKEAHGKRKELIEKYGYDCYLEQDTEFLTDQGWKKFDQITDSDKIAEVEVHTGKILFSRPLEKIDKIYTGNLFIVEPYMSRCVVTPNHNMLVSPAHLRHHGYEYLEKLSDWKLIPIQKMINGEERSWYHTRRCGAPRRKGITVEDSYIKIAGLFISEGSISFRKGKVKSARITQTEQGKAEFFKEADKLGLKRYDYKKETVWTIPRKLSEKLFKDFGHGSRKKRLPNWTYKLSFRQSRLFWKYLCLGDGTKTPNGEVYYSVNGLLAGDIQAMMVSSGHLCSVRGPFKSISNFNGKELITYQVYLSKEAKYNCMDFHGSSRVLLLGQEKKGKKHGYPIKEISVKNKRIVCFEMPQKTLITRSKGKVAFHGNTKFAYNCPRLLAEVEQILTEGTLDLERNREQLKAIRRGEWTKEQLYQYFNDKERQLEEAFHKSTLPVVPDVARIKSLLLECLEHHYGSLSKVVIIPEKTEEALRQIELICQKALRQ